MFKGAIYLSLAACIWGGMYVVSKYALDIIPPLTLLFMRFFIASLVLAWVGWQQKMPFHPGRQWGLLFQIGFTGYFLSVGAQFIGTKLSSAHMGAVITTLSPVFLSVFAVFLLKEKMSFKQGVALLIACVGVLVVMGLADGHGQGSGPLLGNFALLLAALFWGYYSALARQASRSYTPLQITTWGIWLATGLTLPFVFWELNQWSVAALLSGPVIFSILYLGVISTTVALFSWNKGLSLLSAHQAGLFFFLQPIVGSFLGWLILKEALTLSFFAGSFLIIAGVYLVMQGERQTMLRTKETVRVNQA